ncbi:MULTISPECIES: NHLP leader peptide family RiPP precursor [unclassified Stappia]|uniref:NHLP leader peptide family RiPP precursor n=1 Tax=unclassified Stappia TaxID=2629676 RepID=UPI0016436D09|nr:MULTISPECIES: NHLP leader peptide family RiPP precursor [unclassified Stappia]
MIEQNAHTQVLVRAATDEAFRAALLSDATGTLKSLGVEIPEGIEIKAVEDTHESLHLVLPPLVSEDMSDDELAAINGGFLKLKHLAGFGIGASAVMIGGGALAIIATGGAAAPLVGAAMIGGGVAGAVIAD